MKNVTKRSATQRIVEQDNFLIIIFNGFYFSKKIANNFLIFQ